MRLTFIHTNISNNLKTDVKHIIIYYSYNFKSTKKSCSQKYHAKLIIEPTNSIAAKEIIIIHLDLTQHSYRMTTRRQRASAGNSLSPR